MVLRIRNDHTRFNEVIKGRIKSQLKDFIKRGDLIAKDGQKTISLPISHIELPHFKFLENGQGGVGQGKGKKGEKIDKDADQKKEANESAGSDEGQHGLEVNVSLDELAEMLGEELCLPKIENKGQDRIKSSTLKYNGIHNNGPNALRHFKRTFKNALKRQIIQGIYDKDHPIIVPIKEDLRFRSFSYVDEPKANAAIIYMMDVSGSMGDEQKEIVRIESFWIDTWLKKNYAGVECRYLIHDAMAKEVDMETFFHTRESGGTMISSCYKLCSEIMAKDYPLENWNVYPFHFSDGDNWSVDDTRLCINILEKKILPSCNNFCYGQVESPYGSGQFIKDLKESFKNCENLSLSEIKDKDGIYDSIKTFLSGGK